MTVVSDKMNLVFIHNPRTGGTNIQNILHELFPDSAEGKTSTHLFASFFTNGKYRDYLKFGFVRNPWDRYYSIFKKVTGFHSKTLGKECEFFNRWVLEGKGKTKAEFNCQADWFYDKNNNLLVDYIGRFENYEDDLRFFLESYLGVEIGEIPVDNETKRRYDYRDVYYDESIKHVDRKFGRDIELFEYEFDYGY